MATKVYTRQELEDTLEKKFNGKIIRFAYPGHPPINGMCSQVAVDHKGDLILVINDKRCSCSIESIRDTVSIVRN